MKSKLIFFLSIGALLCSCGSSGGTSSSMPPYQPSYTSSAQQRTPTWADATTLHNYLTTYGTYLSGIYAITKTTRVDFSSSIMDMVYYDVGNDTFNVLSSLTVTVSGTGEVRSLGGVSFDLTSFTACTIVGSTRYVLYSGTTLTNTFGFYATYSAYPTFSITKYVSVKTEYAKAEADNAEICAACATRAINHLINFLPTAGVQADLW